MTQIWQLIATIVAGILAGVLMKSRRPEDEHGMLYCILGFSIIGIINFFIGIIRSSKRYAREEEKKKQNTIQNSIDNTYSLDESKESLQEEDNRDKQDSSK